MLTTNPIEQSSLSDTPITIPEFQDQLTARAASYTDEEISVSDLSLSRRHATPTIIQTSLLNMLDDPNVQQASQ